MPHAQGLVTSVAYAADGCRLAAGSAGGAVLLWERPGPPAAANLGPLTGSVSVTARAPGEGTVAYAHAAGVAALAFHPAGCQLASAAGAELVLWSPRDRAVSRHKARPRVSVHQCVRLYSRMRSWAL